MNPLVKNFNSIKLYSKNKSNKILVWWACSDYVVKHNQITIIINYGQQNGIISQKYRYVKSR